MGRRSSFISFISFISLTLGGCSSVDDLRGTVTRLMDAGRGLVQGVQDTVEDIEQRAQKVQDGVLKMQEGKALVEEGLRK